MGINDLSLRWENKKKQRYYRVIVTQDLFAEWVVIKVWGGINQATGRMMQVPCASYAEALKLIENIGKTRIRHGYIRL